MPNTKTVGPFPSLNVDEARDLQRRYVDAWMDASRIMSEATHKVIRRQAELASAVMRRCWPMQADFAQGHDDQMQLTYQIERMTDLFDITSAHVQELADIMLKAQADSLQVLAGAAATASHDGRRAAA